MNLAKNPKKIFLSFAIFALCFGTSSRSLFAAGGCSKEDLKALLQIAEELRTSVKQTLEAARKIGEKVSKIEAKLAQMETAPTRALEIAKWPSKQTKTLSNGAVIDLVHGEVDDAASQVWRDGDTLWAPVAGPDEFFKYTKKHRLTFKINGTKYPNHPAMAKAYCEALKIPGLESVKWFLPEIDVFLEAAGNPAENVSKGLNKLLTEAFPEMLRGRFWSSSSSGRSSDYASVFMGNYREVSIDYRVCYYNSVRCVSRGAGR